MKSNRVRVLSSLVIMAMILTSVFAFTGCGCSKKSKENATEINNSVTTSVKETDAKGKPVKETKAKDDKKDDKKLKTKEKVGDYSEGDGADINDLIKKSGKKKAKSDGKKTTAKKDSNKKSSDSKKSSNNKSSKKSKLKVAEDKDEGWGPLIDG